MAALSLQTKADLGYKAVMALYTALALTLIAETGWFNPPPSSKLIIMVLQLLPLLTPLPWVLKRQLRATAWLCFILCFYFVSGVLDAWFRPEQFYGWLITIFTVLLFCIAMMFIRWQAQALKATHPVT